MNIKKFLKNKNTIILYVGIFFLFNSTLSVGGDLDHTPQLSNSKENFKNKSINSNSSNQEKFDDKVYMIVVRDSYEASGKKAKTEILQVNELPSHNDKSLSSSPSNSTLYNKFNSVLNDKKSLFLQSILMNSQRVIFLKNSLSSIPFEYLTAGTLSLAATTAFFYAGKAVYNRMAQSKKELSQNQSKKISHVGQEKDEELLLETASLHEKKDLSKQNNFVHANEENFNPHYKNAKVAR